MKKIKALGWYKVKRMLSNRRSKSIRNAVDDLLPNQVKILEIINHLIALPKTELTFSALSHTYFMECDNLSCKIGDAVITITNGSYSYEVSMPGIVVEDMRGRFLKHIESRKNRVQRNIIEKFTTTLDKVHSEILDKEKLSEKIETK